MNAACDRARCQSVQAIPADAQDDPHPVQLVAAAAAVSSGVLLDPAADLVDGLGVEPDDVERVQDGAGVLELVVDGVLPPVKRVQRGHLHPTSEVFPAVSEPGCVGLTPSVRDHVQQPGMDTAFARG
ncbi:hypothetical protein ASG78_15525 [Nostocoides sp. Soil756]|nr:hypothetical protein ASG78_15525 [Tetrasphaera sp. Soil756]